LVPLLDAIPPIRHLARARGVTPLIARRGTEHGSGLGTIRWPWNAPSPDSRTSADCNTISRRSDLVDSFIDRS